MLQMIRYVLPAVFLAAVVCFAISGFLAPIKNSQKYKVIGAAH